MWLCNSLSFISPSPFSFHSVNREVTPPPFIIHQKMTEEVKLANFFFIKNVVDCAEAVWCNCKKKHTQLDALSFFCVLRCLPYKGYSLHRLKDKENVIIIITYKLRWTLLMYLQEIGLNIVTHFSAEHELCLQIIMNHNN